MEFHKAWPLFCLTLASITSSTSVSAEAIKGPSSSATPYVVSGKPEIDVISVLTVGDRVDSSAGASVPYRMAGIPDGLGAYDNHDGTFTLLMNHELGATAGVVRQHGQRGAFISNWVVRKKDLKVLRGGDLIQKVWEWDADLAQFVGGKRPFGRFCSADLAAPSAFYNRKSGKGYKGRIFLNGEEVGAEGRAFAHLLTGKAIGTSYELPSLGKFSWENALASPFEQDKTVVIGQDDSSPGQIYVYVGEKQSSGSEIEKAGLHGGKLYGVAVREVALEDSAGAATRGGGIASGSRFALHEFGDVRNKTGEQLQAESLAGGVTEFLRPEDGAWDTRQPNRYYFVTTDRFDSFKLGSGSVLARSRLYRLVFDDIRRPELGGTVEMMLDGTGPQQMLDNLTVDLDGNLILQEDPGNQAHLARIWKFDPRTRSLIEVASHDPRRFALPSPPFNQDEESSGVIDISHLLHKTPRDSIPLAWEENAMKDELDDGLSWVKPGYRYYLATTQAHYTTEGDVELVEGGQLLLLAVPKDLR